MCEAWCGQSVIHDACVTSTIPSTTWKHPVYFLVSYVSQRHRNGYVSVFTGLWTSICSTQQSARGETYRAYAIIYMMSYIYSVEGNCIIFSCRVPVGFQALLLFVALSYYWCCKRSHVRCIIRKMRPVAYHMYHAASAFPRTSNYYVGFVHEQIRWASRDVL